MCKASPGPRCYGHATESHKTAYQRLNKVRAQISKLKDEIESCSDPKLKDKLIKEHDVLRERAQHKLIPDVDRKAEIRDATEGGLEALSSKLQSLKQGTEEYKSIATRYGKAKVAYDSMALAYDEAHGTVDMKKPSLLHLEEDRRPLQRQMETVANDIKRLRGELASAGDEAAKAKLEAKIALRQRLYARTGEKLRHARKTASHIAKGIIKDPTPASTYWEKFEEHTKLARKAAGDPQEVLYRRHMADMALKRAQLADNNGMTTVPVLFDKDGNYVPIHMNNYEGANPGLYLTVVEKGDTSPNPSFESYIKVDADMNKTAKRASEYGYTLGTAKVMGYVERNEYSASRGGAIVRPHNRHLGGDGSRIEVLSKDALKKD